jgi:protocatechuate 3,4-dioxygenase beta subunit
MPHRIFEFRSLFVLYLLFVCGLSLSAATEAGRISGRVLDPQGTSVAGARVKLHDSAGSLVRESASDAQGNFTLESIDTGEYQLTAESDAFVAVVVDVSLATGQQKQINLRFRHSSRLFKPLRLWRPHHLL